MKLHKLLEALPEKTASGEGNPEITGIKADSRLQSVPVVIVSYKDREEDRLRGLDAGANSYLTKSGFHVESLLAAVEDLIGPP